MWRKEVHDAEAKILSIHSAVNQHDMSLDDHIKEIRIHEKAEHNHEVKLSELEQTSVKATENIKDQQAHDKLSKSHQDYAFRHQQFKSKHREIMVLVERLYDLTHE